MTSDVPMANWRKSSYSGKEGNCVELAHFPGETTAMRDSLDPNGPVLTYPATQLAAFVAAAGSGEFGA